MRALACTWAVVAALSFPSRTLPETRNLQIRRDESKIAYSIPFAGAVSDLTGEFKRFDVTLAWDEADPTLSSLVASIQTASIETGAAAIDERVKGPRYFDAENHPWITFRSSAIQRRGDGFVARGLFSLRGTTKEVELPFRVVTTREQILAFTSRWSFNRHDYGVGVGTFWGRLIGDEVTIHIELLMRDSER